MTIEHERIDDLQMAGARTKLVPGAVFPDHELTGHDRKRHRLSEIQGNDPMILILSRGHYCPKDARQHKIMADFYPQIAVAYTTVVTISTDTPRSRSPSRHRGWSIRA